MRLILAAVFALLLALPAQAGVFVLPTITGKVTSDFGLRRHPILKREIAHKGVDFKARANDPLFSVDEGVVESAGPRGTFGNVVQIYFPDLKLSGLYAHLNKVNVKAGQKVEAGQIIGLAGSTGRSTGPHLHFELRKAGKAIDPERYLTQASPAGGRVQPESSNTWLASYRQPENQNKQSVTEGSLSATATDPILAPLFAFIYGLLSFS